MSKNNEVNEVSQQQENVKKGIFKKAARLNVKSENQTPEQKKKTIRNWIIAGSLVTLISLGIGLPVGLLSNTVTYKEKYQNTVNLATIKKDGKDIATVNVGDVTLATSNFFKSDDTDYANAKKNMIFALYNEEVEASKLWERAWNSSRAEGEAKKELALPTVEEVRETQTKKLAEEKRRFQVTYGVSNWIKQFQQELNSAKYGNSLNEKAAIDFLVLKHITPYALARFAPIMNTSYTKDDVETRVANEDIRKDPSNSQSEIIYKKGERIFKDFLNTKNTTTNKDEVNGFLPNIAGHTLLGTDKVAALITNSFIPQKRKVTEILNDYFKIFQGGIYQDSKITLNFKPEKDLINSNWKIAKEDLLQLLRYRVLKITPNSLDVKQNISLLEDFQGAFGNDEQKKQDQLLLDTINIENNKNNSLDKNALKNIYNVFEDQSTSVSLAYTKHLFNIAANPFSATTILEKIKTALFDDAQSANKFLPSSNGLSGKTVNDIETLNLNLETYINGLTDSEINSKIGKVFREAFATSNTDNRIRQIYHFGKNNNLNIVFDDNGMNIILIKNYQQLSDFQNLITSALQSQANAIVDSSVQVSINLSKVFEDLSDQDLVFGNLIQDSAFQDKLITEMKKGIAIEEQRNFIKEVQSKAMEIKTAFITNKAIAAFTKIPDYVAKNPTSDFVYDATTNTIKIAHSSSNLSANEIIYNTLVNGGK